MFNKILSIICFAFILSFVNAQKGINESLKNDLDEILRVDQTFRKLFDNNITDEKRCELLNELNVDEKEFQKKQW